MDKKEAGFTLMELLVVITIVAILSSMFFINYRSQLLKARDATRKTDLGKMKIALESYAGDHVCYPDEGVVVCGSSGLAPYLDKVTCSPGGEEYVYTRPSCDEFVVFAKLEREADPDIEKLNCLAGCGPNGAYNYFVSSDNFSL